MKKAFIAASIALVLANPVMAGDLRLGFGSHHADAGTDDTNYTRFELGYDFNRMLSLNGGYNFDGGNNWDNTYDLDLEIGYRFDLFKLGIKPYASVGAAFNHQINDDDVFAKSGVGLRAQWRLLYADLSYEEMSVDHADDYKFANFTVGLVF